MSVGAEELGNHRGLETGVRRMRGAGSFVLRLSRYAKQQQQQNQQQSQHIANCFLFQESSPLTSSTHRSLVGAEPRSVPKCIAQIGNPSFGFSLLRCLSQAAERVEPDFGADGEGAAPVVEEGKLDDVIKAVPRDASGKIICKKERRAGRVPSIVFGQENGHLGGDKQLLSVETKQIERVLKRIGKSFFLSRTFDLEIFDNEGRPQSKERVLPRSIHLHAGTDKVMNVTFIRAPPTARLKVNVPLVFIGEDACPGIRKGGHIYTMMRTVKYKCPGDAIPPCIEVDLSSLDLGDKILLKDLKVGPGLSLVHTDSTLPVCKVMGSRTSGKTEVATTPAT